jgi:ubiquinone/menaquinone biosynthesis C-methylase UbiE
MSRPPVCSYEGSDYQVSFWDRGGRAYEDGAEAVALKRLLPKGGRLLLEIGAGAGRNSSRYTGFERIVLLDYSHSQLEQAQQRLGRSERYVYVAADAYRLPFRDACFEAATMIRVLHHMAQAPAALAQVRQVLQPGGTFILEFANKLNLKSIMRYLLGRQNWSPFTREPVEFAELNFNFHPRSVRGWLQAAGFNIEMTLTVSHFRIGIVKRIIPTPVLVFLDSLFQWTGAWWQLAPSVFIRCRAARAGTAPPLSTADTVQLFKCPACGHSRLVPHQDYLECPNCTRKWRIRDGIFDFREPADSDVAALN